MSGLLLKSVFLLLGVLSATSTIVTDTGCSCALTKTATTAPNAGASVTVGCSFKTDWTGQTSEWCLADQTLSSCGTFQTGFGWVDSCAIAGFPTVNVLPPPLIEWDQDNTTFYTGQILNVTWTYKNILPDEWVRVQYMGSSLQTLTTGSGTNITSGFFASRLSDNVASITSKNTPVVVNLPSTAAISQNSTELISVIQSKLLNVLALDGNRTLGGGQNAVCDDRNLTVTWRGLGEAQFGLATVSLSKASGSPGTLGTTLTNIPVSGNMTLNIFCPRTSVPSTFNPYRFQISVQEAGGSAYTANSASFTVAAAPTPSPTSSTTPTPSKTPTPSVTPTKSPTPSPSATPTPTSSPSNTRTPTPSITPSASVTPSTTETARPSIDIVAIARNAANSVDTQTPVIGAVVGTLCGVILLLGAYRYYSYIKLTEMRKKKQKMTSQRVQETRSLYGLYEPDQKETTTNVVMYQVNLGKPIQSASSESRSKGNSLSKKGFPPVQGNQV